MRILGLDPGLRHTGWGVIEAEGNHLRFIDGGVVHSDAADALAVRLDALYRGLAGVIRSLGAETAAVEETVVNRNPLSSLKLGHARGVVLLAAGHAGLEVAEYAAKQVKRAVTGTGGARKEQVALMVGILLPGCRTLAYDTADALAVAICHAHLAATRQRLALSIRAAS
jgi:crossover junction endodeoxyribonuclease RuvC